jgi:hypothetical protein
MNNKNISTDKANCLANEDNSKNNIANEVDNIFKEAPSEVRKTAMALMMRTSSGAFHHPIFDKFTPEHIDKFLDLNEQNNKREYHFACSNRWFNLGYALLVILFLIFLIIDGFVKTLKNRFFPL